MAIAWASARRHWWTAVLGILAAGLLMVVAYTLVELSAASDQLDGLRSQQSAQSRTIGSLSSGLSTAESQLAEHGIKPLPPPPQQIIEQGQAGPPGAPGPGPSDAQVAAAVAAYMAMHPVPPGPGPSVEQISAAVAAYLKASPPAPGAQGPGPSDQQVATAVAAYMQQHPAPPGPPGPSGAQGPPGPAPAGWTFTARDVTYDCTPDNQTPGPHYSCAPEPKPTPSPSGSTPSFPVPSPAAGRTTGHAARGSTPVLTPESSTPAGGRPGAPAPRSGLVLALLSVVKLPRERWL